MISPSEVVSEPILVEIGLRKIRHKKQPAFLISKVVTPVGEVDLGEKVKSSLSLTLQPFRAERLLKAVRDVKIDRHEHLGYNCASFAHRLAAMPIKGDLVETPPQGWDFYKDIPIHKLPDGATGLVLQRGEQPELKGQGYGHWYTILDRAVGLVIHVDGGGNPPLISPSSSILATYPPDWVDYYHALPQPVGMPTR